MRVGFEGDASRSLDSETIHTVKDSIIVSRSPLREKVVEKILNTAIVMHSPIILISEVPIIPVILCRLFVSGTDRCGIRRISHITKSFSSYHNILS